MQKKVDYIINFKLVFKIGGTQIGINKPSLDENVFSLLSSLSQFWLVILVMAALRIIILAPPCYLMSPRTIRFKVCLSVCQLVWVITLHPTYAEIYFHLAVFGSLIYLNLKQQKYRPLGTKKSTNVLILIFYWCS